MLIDLFVLHYRVAICIFFCAHGLSSLRPCGKAHMSLFIHRVSRLFSLSLICLPVSPGLSVTTCSWTPMLFVPWQLLPLLKC